MEESGDISIGIVGLSEWDIPEGQIGRGLRLQTTRGPIDTIAVSYTHLTLPTKA